MSAFKKLAKNLRLKLDKNSPTQLLHELTHVLRSDDMPSVFQEAARSVASLLEGGGGSSSSAPNGVTINVTIAVAVGAPGKEPQEGASQPSGEAPTESVVIASAVATFPSAQPAMKSSPSTAERAPDEKPAETTS